MHRRPDRGRRPAGISIGVAIGITAVLALLRLLSTGGGTATAAPACRPLQGDVFTVCLVGGCDYTNVQDAVDAASEGDVIKVAEGVYTGVQSRPAPPDYAHPPASGLITQVVYISKSVTIRGGYTTTDGFAEPPDPEAHPTTLDAQGKGRVMCVTGPSASSGQANSPTVEGLRITGGDADGLRGSPTSVNYDAGGGVYVISATATFSGSRVFGNHADDEGGGLYLYESDVALTDNAVLDNSGRYGSGLSLRYSDATLTGNSITSNDDDAGVYLWHSNAVLDGNTIAFNKDGVWLWDSKATLSDNTIAANTDTGVWLDGSVLTLTSNSFLSHTNGYGGGLYASTENPSTLTAISNTFRANSAWQGAGLWLGDASATLINNVFVANTADDEGGGLHAGYGGPVTLIGNTFISNSAGLGGGACLWDNDATLISNTFRANTATMTGGGLFHHFGGTEATLISNTFIANTAADDGGGAYLYGDVASLSGNAFIANTSRDYGGGGATIKADIATLKRNTFISNSATSDRGYGDGGGLWLRADYSGTLSDNRFVSNAASDDGGGIHVYNSDNVELVNNLVANNQAGREGSGVHVEDSTIRLLHTTIARNGPVGPAARDDGDGSGIHLSDGSTAVLTNTILVSHTVGITVAAGSTARLGATLWGTGPWANSTDWAGAGTILTGTVHLWGDPAFIDPDAGDYHIGPASAAVDAGVDAGVSHDIDDDDRPFDGDRDGSAEFDVGADELTPHLTISKLATPDPVAPGASLTYTIRITNTGHLTLTATVTDTLPIHILPGQTAGGTAILPGGPIAWTPVTIAPHRVWTETVVVTVDVGYAGPLTNVVEVTTEQGITGITSVTVNVPPSAPSLISPQDGAIISDTTPTLIWGASPGAVGYLLSFEGVISDVGDVTEFTTGVLTDGAYTWTVAAYDALHHASGYAAAWSFTVDATVPHVTEVSPVDGATGVPRNAPIVAGFSEAMDTAGVSYLITPTVAGLAETWQDDDSRLNLTHDELTADTHYTITISSGSDLVGNPLGDVPYTWAFTTSVVSAPEANLSLDKDRIGTGDIIAGERITYTLTVTNAGPTAPVTATVVDDFSDAVALAGISGEGCVWTPGETGVTCTVLDVVTGTPSVVTLVVTTSRSYSGVLSNAATVSPAGGVVDPTPDNDSSGPVTVTIMTHVANQRPVAHAGADQVVEVSTTVILDGSDSYDPDGHTPLTYGWRQTGGTPPVLLSSTTISQPTFTAPGTPAILTFTLTVTDSYGLPALAPDQAIVTVTQPDIRIYLPLVMRDSCREVLRHYAPSGVSRARAVSPVKPTARASRPDSARPDPVGTASDTVPPGRGFRLQITTLRQAITSPCNSTLPTWPAMVVATVFCSTRSRRCLRQTIPSPLVCPLLLPTRGCLDFPSRSV